MQVGIAHVVIQLTRTLTFHAADVWEDIADYCRVKETWFREALGMELKNGVPSHDMDCLQKNRQ